MNSYLKMMRNYGTFEGRTTRYEYWMAFLFTFIFAIIAVIIDAVIDPKSLDRQFGLVIGVFHLVHFIPTVSIFVRRLHDTNRSGWWFFLNFIPLVGQIILLVWLCTKSDAEANRFGDPSADAQASVQLNLQQSPLASGVSDNSLDQLDKLMKLKNSGAISDVEFDAMKQKIIQP